MTNDAHDPERPKRLAKSATALSEFFGQRQRIHAQKAQDFGYAKEAFRVVAKNLEQAPDDPLLAAPEESFEKFRVLVETREADADR